MWQENDIFGQSTSGPKNGKKIFWADLLLDQGCSIYTCGPSKAARGERSDDSHPSQLDEGFVGEIGYDDYY